MANPCQSPTAAACSLALEMEWSAPPDVLKEKIREGWAGGVQKLYWVPTRSQECYTCYIIESQQLLAFTDERWKLSEVNNLSKVMQQLNVERSYRICFLHKTYTPITLPHFLLSLRLFAFTFKKHGGGRKEESSTSLRESSRVSDSVCNVGSGTRGEMVCRQVWGSCKHWAS